MKKRIFIGVGLLFVVGVFAAVALAHMGSGTPTCTGATFNYNSFPSTGAVITENVLQDGNVLISKTFNLTSSIGSDMIALKISGAHSLQETASWQGADAGSFTGETVLVDCETVTVTTTVPHTNTVTVPVTSTVVATETVPVTTTVTVPQTTTITHTRTIVKHVTKKCKPKPICKPNKHQGCGKG